MQTPPAPRLTGPGVQVLLVGTGSYDHLPDVPAVAQTVHDLGQALVDRCGVRTESLRTLLDPADAGAVGAALVEATRAATDVLLFYYVGHGLISPEGQLYLGTRTVDRGPLLAWRGIPYDRVRAALLNTQARTTIVILDCCFSGRAVGTLSGTQDADTAADLANVEGSYVLTAAAGNELALAPTGERHTAFTGELLHLLAEGDPDGGPHLTLNDVYRGLRRSLSARGLPQPHHRASATAADLILTANVAHARATAEHADDLLPRELRTALSEELPWKRAGAVFELENQLSSRRPDVRKAAEDALLDLVRDPSPVVARPATQLWHTRGLGEIPLLEAVPGEGAFHGSSRPTGLTVPAGIDFGTTNSAVAVFQDGECRVVPNRLGERSTPSVAALSPQGTWLVGTPARRQAATNEQGTFSSVKLRLGTDWKRRAHGATVDAAQVATVILTELRTAAEQYLGAALGHVVITVPAYFDLGQRHAIVTAAEAADLQIIRLLNEPTAAAMAYGLSAETENTVLVVDLGGGTFDTSLLEIGEGVVEVKATAGDNHLGGDDWDHRITDWLLTRFRRETSVDISSDPTAMQRLREAAEAAKIQLSSAQEALITVPYLAAKADGTPLSLEITMSRPEFQTHTRDLLERIERPIDQVMRDAGITLAEVDTVILVGGATRMPAVGELVTRLTGKVPRRDIIPDGVAIGAAIDAAVLSGLVKDTLLLDVTPLSLGVETTGGILTKLIERNTTIPTKRSEVFTTTEDDQGSVQIRIYQGERELAAENTLIGVFDLDGIERAAHGVPQIELSFDIDANGIVHVGARDLKTATESRLTVTRNISASEGLDGTPSRITQVQPPEAFPPPQAPPRR
jgi:molecular chaperone DnaK